MTEEFLHYIWKFRLFSPSLKLVSGEDVVVRHPGFQNSDSGPDFFNARIHIDHTLWAGNVEIHVKSSDWIRHRHQVDPAYDSVILHVVYQHDAEIFSKNNHPVPTIELKEHIRADTWKKYLGFLSAKSWIACENMISEVPEVAVESWCERLTIERLCRKAKLIEQMLVVSSNDWNQVFFRLLARNMGFKINNEPFEMLAASLSYPALLRHSGQVFQLEAILYGQAGLLKGSFTDEYPRKLQSEFEFLSRKLPLSSMEPYQWKFMRMHPVNFPTIRLSQFAAVICKTSGMVDALIHSENLNDSLEIFEVQASEYWNDHFRFDKPSTPAIKKIGRETVQLLMVNFLAPFIFTFGKKHGRQELVEKAISFLEELAGEDNAIIRKWNQAGLAATTAARSQALLELKSNYCDSKKCLSCRIGLELLKLS